MGKFGISVTLISAITALVSTPALALDEPERLEPSTNWNLDYAEDSCGLSRSFGNAESQVMLQVRQYAPGAPFALTVMSKRPLQKGLDPEIYFGPAPSRATVMTPVPLVLDNGFAGVRIQTYSGASPSAGSALARAEVVGSPEIDQPRWLFIGNVFPENVRLETGSLDAAMAALRDWQKSMLDYWGLDGEAHQTLRRAADLRGKERWSTIALERMPDTTMTRARNSYQYVLLFTDETGQFTQCRALSPNTMQDFAEAYCELAIQRGSANPAIAADGQPIGSVIVHGMGIRTSAIPYYADM